MFHYILKSLRLIVLLLTVAVSSTWAQVKETSPSNNILFINYLIDNGNYHEALTILDEQADNDTVIFLKGWCHHQLSFDDSALVIWGNVNSFSKFGKAARFYGTIIRLHEKDILGAKAEIQRMDNVPLNENETLLKQLMIAGIAIAEKKYLLADSLIKQFTHNNYITADEEKELGKLLGYIQTDKHHSPAKAALLSALLPGSGKWYAGRNGAGTSALLQNVLAAALAVETFIIAGPVSIPFLLGAGVFSVFYAGNIWGSYFTAKQKNYDLEREHQNYLLRTLLVATDRQLGTNALF